jgi:hypothetical protein
MDSASGRQILKILYLSVVEPDLKDFFLQLASPFQYQGRESEQNCMGVMFALV